MTQQQWEFCELGLAKSETHAKLTGFLKIEEVWSYDCYVRYYGPSGEVLFRTLAKLGVENALPFNPYFKAMGLLGAAGWELVGVQHGNLATTSNQFTDTRYLWETLSFGNRIAYFKRPVVAGRAVDEPKLVL